MHVPYAIIRNVLERIVDMGLMNQARIKVEDSVWQWRLSLNPLISIFFICVVVAVNFPNILKFILCELNQKWLKYNQIRKTSLFLFSSFLFWTLFVSAHKHDCRSVHCLDSLCNVNHWTIISFWLSSAGVRQIIYIQKVMDLMPSLLHCLYYIWNAISCPACLINLGSFQFRELVQRILFVKYKQGLENNSFPLGDWCALLWN